MVSHGQLVVDVDAEVEHCGRRLDEGREQWELGGGQGGQLLTCPEPHQLCHLCYIVIAQPVQPNNSNNMLYYNCSHTAAIDVYIGRLYSNCKTQRTSCCTQALAQLNITRKDYHERAIYKRPAY